LPVSVWCSLIYSRADRDGNHAAIFQQYFSYIRENNELTI